MLIIKYLRTTQKESIKTFHMELTRAAPLCVRYLEAAFSVAEKWDMTQVQILVLLVSCIKTVGSYFPLSETEMFSNCCVQKTPGLEKMQVLLGC